MRNAYTILIGKPDNKISVWKTYAYIGDQYQDYLKQTGWGNVGWTHVSQRPLLNSCELDDEPFPPVRK
jgi:hypothetical protein